MGEMRVITNNVPRDLIDAHELSEAERKEFDYLDWEAIDRGEDSAQFFRYKGDLHDLGEFTADWGMTLGSGLPDSLAKWDGYRSDSSFSALVVRFPYEENSYHGRQYDCDRVIVGLVLS